MSVAEIVQLADRIFEQVWTAPKTSVPKIVYHYTNAEGLFGVLSSRRIWATDCRFLNDETESQIGIRLAEQIVHDRFSQTDQESLKQFYEATGYALRSESEDKNFVFSMSSRRDDLTQWRTYARDGQGFTIGFETQALIDNSTDKDASYGFSRVIYDPDVQSLEVNKHISMIEEVIKGLEKDNPANDSVVRQAAISLEWTLSHQSILLKHFSFESEKEWRINTFEDGKDEKVKVRASNGRIVPFIELKLCPEDMCLPIKCIGVGPGFKDAGIQFAVEKLCAQTGFEVEIYNADTPYRRV